MHFAHDAEGDLLAEIEDVHESVLDRRPVIEHQQEARERQHEKKKERHASRAPGVAHLDARLPRLDRMEMQHDVAEHREDALAIGVRDADPEDRLPELARDDLLLNLTPTHV